MKRLMLFEEFSSEINEAVSKDIEKLVSGFQDPEEIAKAIETVGFTRLPATRRTGEYVFLNPKRDVKYVSSTAGWVRYFDPNATTWGKPITTKTPVHKERIESSNDRLGVILRLAMKSADVYDAWKKSGLSGAEFLENKKALLVGKKLGIL